MTDFDTFKDRWQITAKLSLITPLRIGGGQNAGAYSMSQTPVLLSYDNSTDTAEPYIPGSSLKGVLRSNVERIIRTFNNNYACIGVGDKKKEMVLCGDEKCMTCSIFGSQKSGASIRVQDAHLSSSTGKTGLLEDRPHCATSYRINRNTELYEIVVDKKKKPKTGLRTEEVVVKNTSFDITINLDNATEQDVGMIVLALNEFNNRRCYLGGGASRGYGFADVSRLNVTHKELKDDEDFLFRVKEDKMDPYYFCDKARAYLRSIDDGEEIESREFDAYYKAYSEDKLEGNVVVKYDVETITDFQMPGVDESTVTNMGIPIIPGSTIKGFLRHKLIEDGTCAKMVDELFGSTKGQDGHRSKIVVSDAFPKNDFAGKDSIPQGTVLSMWVMFDNVTKEEFDLIKDLLYGKHCITGKRTAGFDKRTGNASKNVVEFGAAGLKNFKTQDFLAE